MIRFIRLQVKRFAISAGCFFLILALNCWALDIKVDEPIKVLFSWQHDKCDELDIPDAGLRVFRRFDGQVVGIASHYVIRPLLGPSVTELKRRDCTPALVSQQRAEVSEFDDRIWLAATWTDDGRHIAAIGHNEYHGELHANCIGTSPRQCRYGVLTLFSSDDGGRSFRRSGVRPIAAPSVQFKRDQGRDVGYFQPSNVIDVAGIKYVFVRTTGGGRQNAATCLMRSQNPRDATSWEVYDGTGFKASSFDPYQDDQKNAVNCAQIPKLNGLVWSVVRHRDRGIFVAILTVIESASKKTRLAFSTSTNLLDWSSPRPIEGVELGWDDACSSEFFHYPSLIDPEAPGRNFDSVGDHALLFLTAIHRSKCHATMDRDLVYRPVRIVDK